MNPDFCNHLNSPAFTALHKALKAGESILFESLWDVPKALLAAYAVHITNKPLLLLTGGMREDKFFDHLETFDCHPVEFPSWETLPGEEIPPSPDLIGKRFEALRILLKRKEKPVILLCPLQALLQKVIPKTLAAPLLTTWKKGDSLEFSSLPQLLTDLGYKRASVVSDKGEFAVRGGILDLFPVGSPDPYRIEFWGNTIEELRTFDPLGQKSIGKTEQLLLSPAQELPLLQKATRLSSIADYLGDDYLVFWDDLAAIEDTYVALKNMPGANSALFYTLDELLKRLNQQQQLFGAASSIEELSVLQKTKERTKHLQSISFEALNHTFHAQRWFHAFIRPIDYFSPEESTEETLIDLLPSTLESITFLNSNATEEEELKQKIKARNIAFGSKVEFQRGYLSSGFTLSDLPWTLLPNAELTGKTRVRRQKWRGTTHTPVAEFHQLSPNDLVVHYHSGIGKYLGIERHINHLGQETEFLALQYADNSKLFVPMSQAYLISRYIGSSEAAPQLSQLGTKRWQNTKAAAQKQIVGYANDLLQLYASRIAHGGFAYRPDSDLMQQFERDFPYTETGDQLIAIQAIKEDMLSAKAMDRLVCGDVGYGKTEVAMRAAFKAVTDGTKQVAVLVPTTVLAMQHYETFCERMSGFPIRIAVLSRFRTPKQNRAAIQQVAEGTIDILIGTHRILSDDVLFKDLGLLIIDEEQRFGVRAKEKLKRFKAGIDCLTLSATPIPRTLYMSLVHARDMSVISTPPQDRLPVKTIIAETDPELIQNALLREFARGGQAFYIHNRVESIYQRADTVQKMVPSARIGIVHGQMDPDDIDPIFHQFKENELELLFATTIVENGIDIPNANTILVDRADTYGVADLYQLRGRVGRWNRAAYAYFLIPKNTRLPELAKKRLNALVEAGGYGGGMKIAMRDLELRGAGDLLGVQQSGQVSAIGFHLYCKLLKRAIDALKKQAPISFNETKIDCTFDARIPEFYVNEVSLRMELYHRFGEANTWDELNELLSELKDRFGTPPMSVEWLYHLSRIRIFASAHQFTTLKFQNFSLLAERSLGKETKQKTLLLPKKVQNSPKELEQHALEQLKVQFALVPG